MKNLSVNVVLALALAVAFTAAIVGHYCLRQLGRPIIAGMVPPPP